MSKIGYLFIFMVLILPCSGCGGKGSLETFRVERRPYMEKVINKPFSLIKNNILEDRSKNGSLLKLYENPNKELLTLVRQDDRMGEIGCFFDFIGDNDKTIIKVYDWICAKDFIYETIDTAVK